MKDWKDIIYEKYKDDPLPSIFKEDKEEKIKSKQNKMETQRTTLSKEVKSLEQQLQGAVLNADAFEQIAIYKRLEIAKSTLLNLD